MAQPANTYDTYDQIGIREDLTDMIYNISPTETPFFSGAKKTKASNTLHEWQTDELAAPGVNAHIEGDDTTAEASSPTTRLSNQTQIFKKSARTSGTANAVDTAGRRKEMSYQIAKRSKEIKRDIETALLANQARVAGNSATARQMAGVPAWIASNVDAEATGVSPTGDGSDARTDSALPRAFSEAQVKNVMQQAYIAGGEPNVLMVGPFNKQAASTFDGGATKFDKSEDKRLTATIDVYVSDFGELKIIPNRFMRPSDALLLDMSYWKIAFLRNLKTEPLAKTGDSDVQQIVGELTLECCNEAANGIVADLTSA